MKKVMTIILTAVLTAIATATIFYFLTMAVLQESLKISPPTTQEIAENPELARYAEWRKENE